MGSSAPHIQTLWVVISALCGVFFLLFDAARYFTQQLGPVRLRRITTGGEAVGSSKWMYYHPENFQLVSGALLQIALIIAVVSTTIAASDYGVAKAVAAAALIWCAVAMVWKFALAFVSDDLAETVLRGTVPVAHVLYYLFWPLLFPLRRVVERIEAVEDALEDDEEVTDEEVRAYIDVGEDEGILEGPEGKMIQSIVDFGDRLAREIMTPRIDVMAFDAKRPVTELARLFSESKYSRIPIYTESIDAITGIVHVKDVFDAILKSDNRPVADIARPPFFVSESKKVSELLREFQSEHVQVAVIVDEYGGTAGIITIEDVLEEIVGDIADEHEEDEVTIVDMGDGSWLVSGLVRVEEIEDKLGVELAGDDYETVAGMIFTTLGRVPKAGAVVTKNGWRFEVERADRRRIYRVRVSPDPEAAAGESEEEA
jgi:CBS domain containing-hemolysin-like protein